MRSSENLLYIRRRLRLTQKQFASLLGVTKDMISKCERGKRTISIKLCHKIVNICKLRDIFDITIEFIRPEE